MSRTNVLLRRGLSIGFFLLALAFGQVLGQSRNLLDLYKERRTQTEQQLGELAEATRLMVPLEGAVDDSTYIVGPNDQFTVSISGLEPVLVQSFVSSDGMLMLAGAGQVVAAGRTLASVRADALGKLQAAFRNVDVELALSRPREFYVHVTGAVPEPGRYIARPVARVEDVLRQAFFSKTLEDPTNSPTYRPAFRNVVVRHLDGTSRSLDLVRYYRTGDIASNPYLQDGDAVQVPAFDAAVEAVYIDGGIPFPGEYDYRSGDTILDLIVIGAGSTDLPDDVVIQHTRRDGEGVARSTTYSMKDLRAGDPVPIMSLDHVHVPESNETIGLASVEGWVHFPGRYPVTAGRTSLSELVNMAGGLREGALLRGAYLERKRDLVPERHDLRAELDDLQRERESTLSRWTILTDSSSALWNMRLGDFDFQGRYYLARWLQMDSRVSVDVAAALEPDAESVYLEPGDRLFIPRDENAVFVIGEVVLPGRLPYRAGTRAVDYVSLAGGVGPRAADTYVIRSGTGHLVSREEPVFSGDYVFVNRRGGETASIEAENARLMLLDQKAKNYQNILQTIGTAVAVVSTVLLIENALNN